MLRSLRLSVFFVCCLFLIGAVQGEELHWQSGRLWVENGRLVVRFNNGNEYELGNLKIEDASENTSSYSSASYYDDDEYGGHSTKFTSSNPSLWWTSLVPKAKAPNQATGETEDKVELEPQQNKLHDIGEIPAIGKPVEHLHFVEMKSASGKPQLFWIRTWSLSAYMHKVQMGSLLIEQDANQKKWEIKAASAPSEYEINYPGDFSESAVFKASGRNDIYYVLSLNPEARHVQLLYGQIGGSRSRGTPGLMSVQISANNHYLLPASVKADEPIENQARTSIDPATFEITFDGKKSGIGTFQFNLPGQSGSGGRLSGDVPSNLIEQKVPRWVAKPQHVFDYLEGRLPKEKILKGVDTIAQPWVLEMSSPHGKSLVPQPRKKGTPVDQFGGIEVNLLAMPVSRILSHDYPSLRDEALGAIAAEALKSGGEHGRPPAVLYVRLPKMYSKHGESEFANQLAQQIYVQSEADLDKGVVLLLDIMDVPRYTTVEAVQAFISEIAGRLRQHPLKLNVAIVMSNGQNKDSAGLKGFTSSRELPLDRYFGQAEILKAIQNELRRHHVSLSNELVLKLVEKIEGEVEKSSTDRHPLADIDQFSFYLASVLERGEISTDDPHFIDTLAEIYLKVTGQKGVGPFPLETVQQAKRIERLLSTSSASANDNALDGREDVLNIVQEKLVAWLTYGYHDNPTLPFVFAGDTGTGKTHLAKALVAMLDGASEIVNFSDFEKKSSFGRGYMGLGLSSGSEDSSDIFDEIQQRVEALRLQVNPLKFLILDEVHARPDVLEKLLPVMGDGDRKASGFINLDGIIPIFIMNVNKESQSYGYLVQHGILDPEAPSQMFTLFKESIGTEENKIDAPNKQVINALAGRLLPGMIFFSPAGRDNRQQTDFAVRLVHEYEAKHKMRLIVQEQALRLLLDKSAQYSDGNYRSIEKALRELFNRSFGSYLSDHPGASLDGGRFILISEKVGKREVLQLVPIDNEPKGDVFILEDSYRRFIKHCQNALKRTITTFEDNAAIAANENLRSIYKGNADRYRKLLESLTRAAEKPLFLVNADGNHVVQHQVDLMAYPKSIDSARQKELSDLIEPAIRNLFDRFAQPTGNALRGTDDELGKTAEAVSAPLVLLPRLLELERAAKDPTQAFARWISAVFDVDRQEQGKNEKVRLTSLETEFFKTHLKMWNDLQESFKAEPLELERQKKNSAFFLEIAKDRALLKQKEPKINLGTLDKFILTLANGDGKSAEEMIKAREEAALSGGANAMAAADPNPVSIDVNAIPVVAGYLVDAIARRTAEADLADLRSEAKRKIILGSPGYVGDSDVLNQTMATKNCEALLTSSRRVGDIIDNMFKKTH